MEELEARFRARSKEKESLSGLVRIGVPQYSEPAFREAVARAVFPCLVEAGLLETRGQRKGRLPSLRGHLSPDR